MASLATRRSPTRRAAEHDLEKALDGMHATKSDRVLARSVFKSLLDKSRPVTLRTAQRRAVEAVEQARKEAADARSIPA